MITENKLLSSIEKEGLHGFKVTGNLDIDSLLLLSSNTIDELIRFARANNIKSIFYNYLYTDEELYLIDSEEIEYLIDESIYSLLKKDITNHNKKIKNIDFERPIALEIFVIYQSSKVGILYYDNWIEAEELLHAEEQLEKFEQKYEQLLQDKREKEEEQFKDLKIKFEEYLLNDDDFILCTNKTLRSHYKMTIFDKEEASEYKCIFMKQMGFGRSEIDYFNLGLFIEMVWRKYKAKK